MKRILRRIANLRTFLYVRRRIETLEEEFQRLQQQLDALKSSLDVPSELVDEFVEWKAQNPIPDQPLVSVIVATYNRARLLTERCIPSVLGQTYTNFELIVVGDGCTDETEELIAQIKDPRLKFWNLAERGQYPLDKESRWMVAGSAAAKKAITMVQGNYVTHLDDDDEYLPERLEKLVELTVKNQCDLVWHPFWWEQADGTWILNDAQEFKRGQVTNASVLYRSWFIKNIEPNVNSHKLWEPGDWNRFRRIKFLDPVAMRYPEPLLRHYKERVRHDTKQNQGLSKPPGRS